MIKIFAFILIIGTILLALVTGFRLVLLKIQVTTFRTHWIKRVAEKPAEDDFIYVALGDSAAQGLGASNPEKGYVGLVAKHIEETTGKHVHVINLSVSGAKIRDVINVQLPLIKKLPRVDLVTVEAGANDVGGFEEVKYRADATELAGLLPANTYVADGPSFKGTRKNSWDDTSRQAAGVMAEAVQARGDLKLARLYDKTKGQGIADFAADFFHPNNRGYKNWAAAFIEAIKQ